MENKISSGWNNYHGFITEAAVCVIDFKVFAFFRALKQEIVLLINHLIDIGDHVLQIFF